MDKHTTLTTQAFKTETRCDCFYYTGAVRCCITITEKRSKENANRKKILSDDEWKEMLTTPKIQGLKHIAVQLYNSGNVVFCETVDELLATEKGSPKHIMKLEKTSAAIYEALLTQKQAANHGINASLFHSTSSTAHPNQTTPTHDQLPASNR